MSDDILKSVDTEFIVELDDERQAKIVYESIKPEVLYSHNDRSESQITLENNIITIVINAKDIVSLRASINSYVRWINLSLDILKI